MTRLSDIFTKSKPGPTVRSAVDLQAAIAALQDSLPGLESKLATAALDASDDISGGDAALADAETALASANARIKALTAALTVAKAREAAEVAVRRYEAQKVQGENTAKLLERSERKADELTAALQTAVKSFHEMLDLRARARLAFAGGYPAQGFYLEPEALLLLLKNEIFRLGGRPFVTSAAINADGLAFPGGVPETVMKGRDELVSLADRLASADDGAVSTMASRLAAIKPASLQS